MAEIINHNPQDNPRLNQIYEILLLAGYFRIRIASLKAFDKVIGGIAWCITSSNHQIEVEYNDEMQIGQKIKVSEHICNALINMKCPYSLQPFQLQGLDVNNIFPVVQWLVKFVYQTRFERQKYNREISVLLGKQILKQQNLGNADKIQVIKPQRSRINKQIAHTTYDHPIRVYSSLLEYNDVTAIKMYNKLHSIMNSKNEKTKKSNKNKKDGKQKDQDDLMTYLQNQEEQEESNLNNFGEVGNISLTKLERIIEDNKAQLQTAIKESEQDYLNNANQFAQNQDHKLTPEDKELRSNKIQNDKYEAQLQVLQNQLQNLLAVQKQIQEERKEILEKRSTVKQSYEEVRQKYVEIEDIGNQIETELGTKKSDKDIQKLVEKKMKLKQKKIDLKKSAKAKIQELEEEKMVVEASIPEIDEEAFKNMLEEADMKKEIYDKKYEELTKVNQQLAILQRKAEDYTSPAQISQYHQRFVELFEAINCSIEEKKSIYSEMTNLESIRKLITNYQEFLNNAKGGVVGAKKKNDKRELAQNLKEILGGFQGNMKNAKGTLQKLLTNRETSMKSYLDLVKLQREYLKVLRNFKVEYQNIQKIS